MNAPTSPTLLIVDDSRVSRMMIRGRIKQARPGWSILEASSGDEALELVRNHHPDFISMDVNMSGMDGFETVRCIRETGSNARVVMLTANIQESSRERAAQLGACFVQKPATDHAIALALEYFAGS